MAEETIKNSVQRLGDLPPSIEKTEIYYPTTDGTRMRALLYQPTSAPQNGSPLIFMIHGGGWTVGAAESEEASCRAFVQNFGAVCLSISYRLAPEFRFPYAVTNSWDALRFAAANASSWNASPAKGFIVGGLSAGGNLAAVMTHLARDHDLQPPLTGQYLACPAICPPQRTPAKYPHLSLSYEQNKFAPVLPQVTVDIYMEAYVPDVDDSRFSVLCHPDGQRDLPQAYIQVCGLDTFRDEGLIYEKVLREECGAKTKLDVYPGLPHGFWYFYPSLNSVEKFRAERLAGMKWLLEANRG